MVLVKNPFKAQEPKRPVVSKTVERDFEREYGKLQQLDEQIKKLYKDVKKCAEADGAVSKSALKITADLQSSQSSLQDDELARAVDALDLAFRRVENYNQEKVNQLQKTVIEPMKKFSSVFPSLNVAVKRREQALQECKKLQAKLEKYEEREKTGPNIAKTHQSREELKPVRDEFEQRNKALLEEMPQLYTSRAEYFQPSFEALVRSQVNYYAEVSKIFRDLSEKIDVAERTDEQREQENEARLAELRSLSIVAND
ncbi:unnamed protein product [Lampetra planeri]